MTDPEVMLWVKLRRRADDGLKFRNQHAIGPYILDFFCAKARLAIEIDGAVHGDDAQIAHDERRDAWLRSQGVMVCRVGAGSVFEDVTEVADGVRRLAAERVAAETWKYRGA
jgi:very-short-patch-repair endonuclease